MQSGVDDALALAEAGRPTTVKTRIVAHHQQVVRADRERTDDLPAEVEDALLERAREALPSCRAVVVSDYQKGVVTARVMKSLRCARVAGRACRCWSTPRSATSSVTGAHRSSRPNQAEAEQASGVRIRDEADLRAAGEKHPAPAATAARCSSRAASTA